MDQLPDISDIASLAATLQRTANMARHYAVKCEEIEAQIRGKDAEIAVLQEQLAAKKGKK